MTTQTPISDLVSPSSRLKKLPPYIFAWLDDVKAEARARGAQLIDLGMGNPDLPTPQPIIDAIQKAASNPANHGYPAFKGKLEFRQAAARWMKRRYSVDLNPETEVQALIGSKEGLAHLMLAYMEEGRASLVPSPYYPVHGRAGWLTGGEVVYLNLSAENKFLPDLKAIPDDVAKKAVLFFVNYPNNPTAAIADRAFYEELVAYCKKHQIILVSDMAYGEISFDDYRPLSIFNIPGAMDIAIEFHSFSKSFNMAGWRMGFACGNAEIIKNLYSLKSNLDYGICSAVQDGGIFALDHAEEFLPDICNTYKSRMDVVIEGFRGLGWTIEEAPKATLYVWLPVPAGFTSQDWCTHLIDTCDVVVTPGSAFGTGGEGYFRVSLVSPEATLQTAIQRLKDKGIRYSAV
jgi:LL-diaminopimelate aminotransferase